MTVKAEDRPSGSAGDSASVSTPLFRISVEFVTWRVLVATERSDAACICQAPAKVPNSEIRFLGGSLGANFLICNCLLRHNTN